MKPLNKVVTASDVQGCLYYVHVDSLEDDKIREALQAELNQNDERGGAETDMQPRDATGILRKPLRTKPDLVSEKCPELPPTVSHLQSSMQNPHGSMQIGRKAVGQYQTTAGNSRSDPASEPSAPHLLGPRPMHPRLRSIDSAALENSPERRNDDARRWSEIPSNFPKLPTRPSWGAEQYLPRPPPRPSGRIQEGSQIGGRGVPRAHGGLYQARISNSRELSEEAGSLTLIRRYHNSQWNVGKISRISGTTSSNDLENTNQELPGVEIQGASIAISTPGYAKFTGQEVVNDYASRSSVVNLPDRPSRDEQVCFTRQLQAANYMKTLDERRKPEFSGSTLSKHGFSSKFKIHKRSRQATSDEMTERNTPPTSSAHQTVDSKGYVFQSPWDGMCEFQTGVAGRSLKCKHILSPQRALPQSQGRSAPVSELRFNLPSSKSLGAPSRKSKVVQDYSEGSKRSSVSSAGNHHRFSSSGAVEESYEGYSSSDDRLDLSLGQERAGGGFGGKQAKL
ncbi:hypothetical protein MMC29_007833, partial [Sticta canariensis]|nr:hypothetical protein [Sticta canariensis]